MKHIFQKNWVQRFLYSLGFLILVGVSLKDGVKGLWLNSSLGIPYWLFLIVPGIILLYQIFYNNTTGWLLFIGLYSLYLVWAFYEIIKWFKEKSDYLILKDYLILVVIVCVLLLIWYLFILLKPVKRV
jgi:hypothetical protein